MIRSVPPRPPLTKGVVRGLRAIRSLAVVELESGPSGAFDPSNGGGKDDSKTVNAAIKFIDALLVGRE